MEWLSHQKYMVLWDVKVRYEKSEKVTSLKVKKKKKFNCKDWDISKSEFLTFQSHLLIHYYCLLFM